MTIAAAMLLATVTGCGKAEDPPTAEQQQRAQAAGFAADLVYVTDLKGYHAAAGASGVYGDAGYQQIYTSDQGDELRLTVERRSIDASTCAKLPIPGTEPATTATCTKDGDGWRRVSGDRQEYAIAHGDVLVRASDLTAATSPGFIRSATTKARPADSDELQALLPPAPETVQRGDIHGDNAPDNSVPEGAGG
jgi:hypothetical protein